ncbi:MAG: 1-(5-phosphoribosyl)-5-[(5-phosphoribosylamino)methylideneamino]imidazole-4-carboxamide isomerase [Chloroflexi bacterium]|nr:1-(5-phosphoribosyl)-5-[(5-phosphoribosylamino)methylideneamino]imidazole-4-carboxamide isomerase [Chloroflexota bacterium]MBT7080359.1 1-(5-phosphoribosyl)-5-[(5-phosphoribosylamino)methylideneamino]imidazole-4-carboxamide isomerase [Chloroflexota bacterium]MBT7289797.1 1-(5-phosphoribosyl)-5-[(5-phosphoribosylamino)methylideneamino]imidazole-4-carboxamide isomerase [Chloroflexota bacterium]
MEIIPAIDLRNGKCVRLYQGDYDRETVFGQDPVAMAKHWQDLGATRLHVVDLDGAKSGRPINDIVINDIVQALDIPIELGGGIRDINNIEQMINIGVGRVILGTIAVENPDLVREACAKYGEGIVVGIDADDGYVKTRGWKEQSTITAIDLAKQMEGLGAKRFIYTDISRDGTLAGPNFEATALFQSSINGAVIASGGVSSLSDIVKLAQIGVEGAITGQAIYTGKLDLIEALRELDRD